MGRVGTFEDLIAWQKARHLAGRVYAMTRTPKFSADWSLARQMQRAAVSVVSNIAEGHERGGSKDFARFLLMAKGSSAELRAQAYLATDVGLLADSEAQELLRLATEVGRLIGGVRRSVLARVPPRSGPGEASSAGARSS